jgi:hypothetical protein
MKVFRRGVVWIVIYSVQSFCQRIAEIAILAVVFSTICQQLFVAEQLSSTISQLIGFFTVNAIANMTAVTATAWVVFIKVLKGVPDYYGCSPHLFVGTANIAICTFYVLFALMATIYLVWRKRSKVREHDATL